MNIATNLSSFLKASATFLVTVVGFLFNDSDDERENRPLADGSELFGEHNFRTGNLDAGTDPEGWYEEDL